MCNNKECKDDIVGIRLNIDPELHEACNKIEEILKNDIQRLKNYPTKEEQLTIYQQQAKGRILIDLMYLHTFATQLQEKLQFIEKEKMSFDDESE